MQGLLISFLQDFSFKYKKKFKPDIQRDLVEQEPQWREYYTPGFPITFHDIQEELMLFRETKGPEC